MLKLGMLGAASTILPGSVLASKSPKGTTDACIMLWLGGGLAQIDTFDPKRRGDGKKKAGSYYDSIPTAIPGAPVCERLPGVADRLDRRTLICIIHHDIIDEHAVATNLMRTERPVNGTVTYPSIGSVVAHERGSGAEAVPACVVIGYPNVTRGPRFLGSKHGCIYLTDTEIGPTGLTPPAHLSPESSGALRSAA